MVHEYIICTSIPRDFSPEVEGSTLDSIAETCGGYVYHSIPLVVRGDTEIHITLNRSIDGEPRDYLVGQLEAEFGEEGEPVVLGICESRR